MVWRRTVCTAFTLKWLCKPTYDEAAALGLSHMTLKSSVGAAVTSVETLKSQGETCQELLMEVFPS